MTSFSCSESSCMSTLAEPFSDVRHLIGIPKGCHLKLSASVACIKSSLLLRFPRILRLGFCVKLPTTIFFFFNLTIRRAGCTSHLPCVPSMCWVQSGIQSRQDLYFLSTESLLIHQTVSAYYVPHTVVWPRMQQQENSLKSLPLRSLYSLRTCNII